MALFSERQGITPKKAFQIEKIDEKTRISIFNKIYCCYEPGYEDFSSIEDIFDDIYLDFYKMTADKLYQFEVCRSKIDKLKETIFDGEWYEVFDLIEFIFEIDDSNSKNCLKENLNQLFKKENVAYSIINWKIVQITDDIEIDSMEKAFENSPTVAKKHLEKALDMLYNRSNPDYKNSVKESISAVESVCKLILDNKNATLGQALNEIERNTEIEIPTSLKNSFSKLYGYTSSEDGIRHASFDDKDLDYDIAKLLLVSCSAFTNYLLAKSNL